MLLLLGLLACHERDEVRNTGPVGEPGGTEDTASSDVEDTDDTDDSGEETDNQAPSAPVVSLTAGVLGADELVCTLEKGGIDPEGSPLTYTASLFYEGMVVDSAGFKVGDTFRVPAAETRIGEWACEAIAFDGEQQSAPAVDQLTLEGPWCGTDAYDGPPTVSNWWDRDHFVDHDFSKELDVGPLMEMSDEEILAIVPTQTGNIHACCPDQVVDNVPSVRDCRQNADYIFDPYRPNQFSCKAKAGAPQSTAFYPDNPIYPNDQVQAYEVEAGHDVETSFYYDAEYDRRYFLEGMLNTARHNFLAQKMYALAMRYVRKGDAEAGRKAMLILDAYTDVWPDYIYSNTYRIEYRGVCDRPQNDNCTNYDPCKRAEMTRDGRRGDPGAPRFYNETLDLLRDTAAMVDYEEEAGIEDFMQKSRDTMYTPYRYRCGAPSTDAATQDLSQSVPGASISTNASVYGSVEDMHLAAGYLPQTPFYQYFVDGGFQEGTGYTHIQLGELDHLRHMNGYSDPEGYTNADGERIDDFTYPTSHHDDFYRKVVTHMYRMGMPYGGPPIIGEGSGMPCCDLVATPPRRRSEGVYMEGIKHAVLGAGVDDEQVQVHLNFGVDGQHNKEDTLNFQLYAFGHYLISSPTYWSHSLLRAHSNDTRSHNTGIFDQRAHVDWIADGDVVLLEYRYPGFSAISVEGKRAYAGMVDKNRRTLVLNTVESSRPYVVDIYEMTGGLETRDYMMRAAPRYASYTPSSDADWQSIPGECPLARRYDGDQGRYLLGAEIEAADCLDAIYGQFFHVTQTDASRFWIDYQVDDPWNPDNPAASERLPYIIHPETIADDPAVGVRQHVVLDDGQEAYWFDSAGRESDAEASLPVTAWEENTEKQLMLRHTTVEDGDDRAVFVVVHEPYLGETSIASVERVDAGDPDLLAVAVTFTDGRQDVVFYALQDEPLAGQVGETRFEGRLGMISKRDGSADGYLVGGTALSTTTPSIDLRSDVAEYRGEITATHREWDGAWLDGFTVTIDDGSRLPEGRALEGAYVRVTLDGELDLEETADNWSPYIRRYNDSVSKYYQRGVDQYDRDPDHPPYAYEYPYNLAYATAPAQMGGSWAFPIHRIHHHPDGTTQIETRGDHGLRLADDVVEELFLPSRRFLPGGELTFSIVMGAATVDTPRLDPADPFFVDEVQVRCETDAPNADVLIAETPSGDDTPSWQVCEGELLFNEDTELLAYTDHPDGLAVPEPIRATLASPLDAYGEGCQDGVGVVLMSRLDAGGLPEPMGETDHITDDGFFRDTTISGQKILLLESMLKVDEEGVYTLYLVTPKDKGSLTLSGRPLKTPEQGLFTHVASYPMTVMLEPGFHTLEILTWSSLPSDTVRLEWEGPGFSRREVAPTDLFVPTDEAARPFNKPPYLSGDRNAYAIAGELWEAPFTVADDGLPAARALDIAWSAADPNVTIRDDRVGRPEATFSQSGVYALELKATDSFYAIEDIVGVTVFDDEIGTVIEAEDYDALTGAAVTSTESKGAPYSGSGFVQLLDEGDTVEMTVEIPRDGVYDFDCQYAANGHTEVDISIEAVSVQATFHNTGSAQKLQSRSAKLGERTALGTLSAGTHTLTVACSGCADGKAIGLDYLQLRIVE
ncbi:MAG: hypothetical protein AAFV53_13725 [Myxococcota bacterium]